MAASRLDTDPEAGQAPASPGPVGDEFEPTRFVRLSIAPGPGAGAAEVTVHRVARGPELAATVIHADGQVTEIRWDQWHRENPQEWTPAAEAWIRAWIAQGGRDRREGRR